MTSELETFEALYDRILYLLGFVEEDGKGTDYLADTFLLPFLVKVVREDPTQRYAHISHLVEKMFEEAVLCPQSSKFFIHIQDKEFQQDIAQIAGRTLALAYAGKQMIDLMRWEHFGRLGLDWDYLIRLTL